MQRVQANKSRIKYNQLNEDQFCEQKHNLKFYFIYYCVDLSRYTVIYLDSEVLNYLLKRNQFISLKQASLISVVV